MQNRVYPEMQAFAVILGLALALSAQGSVLPASSQENSDFTQLVSQHGNQLITSDDVDLGDAFLSTVNKTTIYTIFNVG